MKKVILIGDSTAVGSSVSVGYGPYLREMLAGSAHVFLPVENCQDTRFTSSCLTELFYPGLLATADVIHWNNGLWDVLHFLGNPRNVVPLNNYTKLVEKIYASLRSVNPEAKIVFATTIPVVEFDADGGSYRKHSEIEEYNAAVKKLFAGRDIVINDLYEVCKDFDASNWTRDCVHLTDESSRILAERCASVIEPLL